MTTAVQLGASLIVRVDLFDYDLPESLIAQHPCQPRDASRLLVVDRKQRSLDHRRFSDLPDYLQPGDSLVLNDTRVVRARILGERKATGGRWEGLFLRHEGECWEVMARTRGKPSIGERITVFGRDQHCASFELELVDRSPSGSWWVRPISEDSPDVLLEKAGHVPLPPYIRGGKDCPEDRERYQTVFARSPGAVAAPTAGLHFTSQLLERLKENGVNVATVTLHVGPGTFQPVSVEDANDHIMHEEWYELTPAAVEKMNEARSKGRRIVAVGTTCARVLESSLQSTGDLMAQAGRTRLFITPGYSFRATDALITNFHLPRSTLLMLVCAFADRELVLGAYEEAVRRNYRFYSYGDAMLLI